MTQQAINWAGFGTGMMAGMGYPELQALGGKLVAIGAKTPEEVAEFLDRNGMFFPDVTVTGTVDEVIGEMRQDPSLVDNVYVATIPTVHKEHALAVTGMGYNLLLEKGGIGGTEGLAEIVRDAVMDAGVAFDLNSQYRHHYLLDVSLRSLITGENIADDLRAKCGHLGKALEAEIEYPQGYQENERDPLGWKARVDLAGRGKNVSDLGVHMIMTLLEIFDAEFESFEGQTYNVHPKRWNPAKSGQTFTSGPSDDAEAESVEMDMFDSTKYNGDDVSVASFVLKTAGDKRIPGTMYTTQVEGHKDVRKAQFLDEGDKGNYGLLNGPNIRIKFENGYVLWKEKQPNALEITDLKGNDYRVYERSTNPGLITSPFQHPDGIRMSMRRGVYKMLMAQAGGPGAIEVYSQRNVNMMVEAARIVNEWLEKPLKSMADYQAPLMPKL